MVNLLCLGVLLVFEARTNREAIWDHAKRTTPRQFPSQLQALDSVPLSLVKAEADLLRKRWSSKQKVKPVSSVSTEEQQHRRDGGGDEMSSGVGRRSPNKDKIAINSFDVLCIGSRISRKKSGTQNEGTHMYYVLNHI